MGSPERKQARAASGSHQMLYSAAGVTFPTVQAAPPMTTQRPTFERDVGRLRESEGDVREGAEGHQDDPGVGTDGRYQRAHRVAAAGGRRGGG